MKRIPLTQNQYAIVDDEDYALLSQHKWFAQWDPKTKSYRAARTLPFHNDKRGRQLMHRLIMGEPKGRLVDHKNHDTLDNTRSNLRLCNNSQNSQNGRKQVNNRSGFRGVTWHKRDKKWAVNITLNGKQRALGYYSNKIEAAATYNAAAAELFGEFANFNELPVRMGALARNRISPKRL
jgi:hypothetical protein